MAHGWCCCGISCFDWYGTCSNGWSWCVGILCNVLCFYFFLMLVWCQLEMTHDRRVIEFSMLHKIYLGPTVRYLLPFASRHVHARMYEIFKLLLMALLCVVFQVVDYKNSIATRNFLSCQLFPNIAVVCTKRNKTLPCYLTQKHCHNIWRVEILSISSLLLLDFFIQGQHKAFTAIPIALLRTFSMMLGEMDFLNTFVNPHFCGGEDTDYLENGIPPSYAGSAPVCMGGDDRKLPHPISSFLMLGIFMVFMPILLMNLLIGLAVGDIESVRRNAQLKRLAMQVSSQLLWISV